MLHQTVSSPVLAWCRVNGPHPDVIATSFRSTFFKVNKSATDEIISVFATPKNGRRVWKVCVKADHARFDPKLCATRADVLKACLEMRRPLVRMVRKLPFAAEKFFVVTYRQ